MVNEFGIDAKKRSFQLGIHPCAIICMGTCVLRPSDKSPGKSLRILAVGSVAMPSSALPFAQHGPLLWQHSLPDRSVKTQHAPAMAN